LCSIACCGAVSGGAARAAMTEIVSTAEVYDVWKRRWEAALAACEALGGRADQLVVGPAGSADEVKHVEEQLGRPLPSSFSRVVTEFSAKVEMSWFLPEALDPPEPFRSTFCGKCSWDLRRLPELDGERLSWIREVFPNREDAYDVMWHDKLAVQAVGNGDYLAIGQCGGASEALVYLSHDDGKGHGYALGSNFFEAIDRWTRVACCGAEDWQWLPFVTSATSGVNPDCDNAEAWRKWFGLKSDARP